LEIKYADCRLLRIGHWSAFATDTLSKLGYTNVKSLVGGFNKWKDDGFDFDIPKTLSSDQYERYQRHILLPEVGEVGQQKLFDAKILLLGAGGLGSPAPCIATSGVGTLGVIDMDLLTDRICKEDKLCTASTMLE
jgi:hypothetical protein